MGKNHGEKTSAKNPVWRRFQDITRGITVLYLCTGTSDLIEERGARMQQKHALTILEIKYSPYFNNWQFRVKWLISDYNWNVIFFLSVATEYKFLSDKTIFLVPKTCLFASLSVLGDWERGLSLKKEILHNLYFWYPYFKFYQNVLYRRVTSGIGIPPPQISSSLWPPVTLTL